MEQKIFIVIPVFNSLDYTLGCLTTLRSQTYQNYEVIVVDDGSTDGTSEVITRDFPEVTLLSGDGNLWWTGATNMGVEYALSKGNIDNDFVLTLNNDLEVNSDYLSNLIDAYQANKPCLIGSLSVNFHDPEKIEFLGIKCNYILGNGKLPISDKYRYSQLVEKVSKVETDVLPGRGTLIPLIVFKKVGLFDFEYFPQYLADHDFSIRARKAGYDLYVSTKSVVKSYVDKTGVSYKAVPSFKTFLNALTSIKSPNRLKTKFYWAKRHSPIGVLYFFIATARIFLSFFKSYFSSLFRQNNRIEHA